MRLPAVTTVWRTKLGTMLLIALANDGTTGASAYFRCRSIVARRILPLKSPKFLSGVTPLRETSAPKRLAVPGLTRDGLKTVPYTIDVGTPFRACRKSLVDGRETSGAPLKADTTYDGQPATSYCLNVRLNRPLISRPGGAVPGRMRETP